jgi:hypothetical protein
MMKLTQLVCFLPILLFITACVDGYEWHAVPPGYDTDNQ